MAEEACRVRGVAARKLVLQGFVSLQEGLMMMDGEYDCFFVWNAWELPHERDMTHYREWSVYDSLISLFPHTKEDRERLEIEGTEDLTALLEKTYGHEGWFSVHSVCKVSNEDFIVQEGEETFHRFIFRFKKKGKIVSVSSVLKGLLEGTTTQGS